MEIVEVRAPSVGLLAKTGRLLLCPFRWAWRFTVAEQERRKAMTEEELAEDGWHVR